MINNRFFHQAMRELGVVRGELLYRDKTSFQAKGVDDLVVQQRYCLFIQNQKKFLQSVIHRA